MGGRYDMGATTLTVLRQQTSSSNQDLGALVKRLLEDATPLEYKFEGEAKKAFDGFKARAEQVSANLNSALAAILGGQTGMDTSFVKGEQDMVDQTNTVMGKANFDAARFGSKV